MSEVDIVINDLHHTIANFTTWMQPEYVSKNLVGVTMILLHWVLHIFFIYIKGLNNDHQSVIF